MKSYKLIAMILLIALCGCGVYYNTFFLAKKNFGEAEKDRKKNGVELVRGGAAAKYTKAIEKASRVLEFHPDSKYVDDALFMIGRAYYHTSEFTRAETKFRELLATHPESEYVEEAVFYLGKTRYQKEDFVGARESFNRTVENAKKKDLRAEATFMLGEIVYFQEDWQTATEVYQNYLNEFGKGDRSAEIQYKIANSYYFLDDYATAKDAYVAVGRFNPEDTLMYRALFNAADCMYQLEQPDSGLALYDKLASDDKNYNELPNILLQIADGHERKGEFETAVERYNKLIEEFPRTDQSAEAYFYLGLIYQEHYFDLEFAKAMYDSCVTQRTRNPITQLAVARSADIGKLDAYRSGKSSDDIEDAVRSQYLLAELYLTQLDQPDSALLEYHTLVDSFPESEFAPKSLLAIGWIHEIIYESHDSAHYYYMSIVENHPNSDWVVDAMVRANVDPDSVETDYPGKRYAQAEQLLFDEGNYEEANRIFQSIVDDYPNSTYAPKASFAMAWSLANNYPIAEPDSVDSVTVAYDSTYIHAFEKVVELYGTTEYGQQANVLLSGGSGRAVRRQQQEEGSGDDSLDQFADSEFDSVAYLDSVARAIEEEIRELPEAPKSPQTIGVFEYPISAYNTLFEGVITMKIKIDFTGEVTAWEFLLGTDDEDIKMAISEMLEVTYFNPADIDPIDFGKWFIFKYNVILPEELRDQRRAE